jgi:hypothetical protein
MPKDVIITPASGKLDFYATTGGSVLANINLTDNNDLSLSTTSGNLIIGDASRDVYIGDGTNEVDIVFEQNGEIRSVAGKYITVNAGTVNATGVAVNTSSPTAVMHVYGSTPSGTVLNVEGTNGSLFSVVDNLDGTLMSVNNNAGLPVLEVFSDDKIVGGRFGQNDFVISSSGNVGIGLANPSTKLEVSGTVTATTFSGAGTNLTGTASSLTAGSVTTNANLTGDVTSVGNATSIAAGVIVNADINAAAAIADTKLATISTAGKVANSATTATSANSDYTIVARDESGDFSAGTITADLTGNASTVTNGVYTISNQSVGGVKTFTSQIINTTANSTANGGGQIYLNGLNGNRIDFSTAGVAAPAFTTRSAGTKILLYPNIGASTVDFALGIDNATFWQSVPNSASNFRWYGGTTNVATLTGAGNLTLAYNTAAYTVPTLTLQAGVGNIGTMKFFPMNDGAGGYITFNSSANTTTNGTLVGGTSTMTGYHGSRRQGAFQWVGGATDATSRFEFLTANGGTTAQTMTSRMAITAQGRVGIGLTSPSYPLHVNGILSLNSASIGNAIVLDPENPSIVLTNSNADTVCNINDTSTHFFGDFNADGLYFDKADIRVGIGTITPSATLNVVGDAIVDNLRLDGNTLSATNTNGSLIIAPNGTGALVGSSTGNPRGNNAVDLQNSRSAVTQVASGTNSVIGGGQSNTSSGVSSTVGGGAYNTSSGFISTVGGGGNNTSSTYYSTVGGGSSNTSSGYYSTVVGGRGNTSSGFISTVGGGRYNTSSSTSSTVGGGQSNTSSGLYSTVGGGQSNTSSAYHSTVPGGLEAKATKHGELSHAAGQFGNQGDAQHTILIARKVTTTDTTQILTLDGGSALLTLPIAQTTWAFSIKLSVYNSTQNLSAGYNIRGCIRRNNSDNVSIIGSNITESWAEGQMVDLVVTVTADNSNKALQINVTPYADRGGYKTMRWLAVVDISQVSFGTP